MRLLKPGDGSVKMLCLEMPGDRPETKQKAGYTPELPRFPRHLKGRELLDIYGRIYGMTESARKEQIPWLLEMVCLKVREGTSSASAARACRRGWELCRRCSATRSL